MSEYDHLDTGDHPDPRITERRIRVSDVVLAGDGDKKWKNYYFWELEPEQIQDAINYYIDHQDEYDYDEDIVTIDELEEVLSLVDCTS